MKIGTKIIAFGDDEFDVDEETFITDFESNGIWVQSKKGDAILYERYDFLLYFREKTCKKCICTCK